jgi:1-phosphofructokinase
MTRTSAPTTRDQAEDAQPDAVVIFAPLPILTVTVEDRSGTPDIHVHAGGQGVWQSRMVSSLGVPVVLCCRVGGETGEVLGPCCPSPM